MATKRNNTRKTTTKNQASSEENKKRPIFIKYFPEKLCRNRISKSNNSFVSVSFKLKDVWASFALSPNMVKPSTKKDGEIITGRNTLFLGDAHQRRKVSISDGNGGYKYEEMSNSDISRFINDFQTA